jgi:tRNA pseudouridine38-40 synthase
LSGERTLKLTVEYDGTNLGGWQRQKNARTVQEELERALEDMLGERVPVTGAGRTDAGVHARAQVASIRTGTTIPSGGLLRGLNSKLPRDVAVVGVDEVPAGFDARRWARGKRYGYRLLNRVARSPLLERTSWHVRGTLDTAAMTEAAGHLLGEHDFSAFRALGTDHKTTIRTIRRLDIVRDGDIVLLDVEGTAFLRHMIRILAGTLVAVGLGRRTPASIEQVLASCDRTQAGRTAPPQGLTLEAVFYGEGPVTGSLVPSEEE